MGTVETITPVALQMTQSFMDGAEQLLTAAWQGFKHSGAVLKKQDADLFHALFNGKVHGNVVYLYLDGDLVRIRKAKSQPFQDYSQRLVCEDNETNVDFVSPSEFCNAIQEAEGRLKDLLVAHYRITIEV